MKMTLPSGTPFTLFKSRFNKFHLPPNTQTVSQNKYNTGFRSLTICMEVLKVPSWHIKLSPNSVSPYCIWVIIKNLWTEEFEYKRQTISYSVCQGLPYIHSWRCLGFLKVRLLWILKQSINSKRQKSKPHHFITLSVQIPTFQLSETLMTAEGI